MFDAILAEYRAFGVRIVVYALHSQSLKILGKPGKKPEKISGESGKDQDSGLNSSKNNTFSPLSRDFGNLKSVLIDKTLQLGLRLTS